MMIPRRSLCFFFQMSNKSLLGVKKPCLLLPQPPSSLMNWQLTSFHHFSILLPHGQKHIFADIGRVIKMHDSRALMNFYTRSYSPLIHSSQIPCSLSASGSSKSYSNAFHASPRASTCSFLSFSNISSFTSFFHFSIIRSLIQASFGSLLLKWTLSFHYAESNKCRK